MLISAPVDETAQVLADPLRARIVSLLAAEAMCTCHLVDALPAGQTTVSHHLRVLREAGWVRTEPRGRFTYYRLRPEPLEELAARLGSLAQAARTSPGRGRPC
ncbi:MAG TPA: metalloregulator ArsR/SmtB family transcription factor [Candidatus Micrarchaeia archaeon]|nr:metalloregulator ArsR/SmtB family transcription factor [Candidatus Micrarchaeia archaeon]